MNEKKPEPQQKIPPAETPPAQGVSGQTLQTRKERKKKTPEFWDNPWKWIYYKLGLIGLASAAFLMLVGLTLWNWEKVQTLPGVSRFLELLTTIPKADPSKYSVGVALFDNDPSGEHHRIVVAALTSFAGIQVLAFERVISPRGADATAAEHAGHAKAREYLRESRAQALVWGEVLTKGQESVPRLFWTVAQEVAPLKGAERYQIKDFALPEIFWTDLKDILVLVAATQAAEFEAQSGRYIADRLKPFIEKTRNLVNRSHGSAEINVEQRTKLLVLFADSVTTFGEQAGDSKALGEAIAAYREALKERTRVKVPLAWATTQNNMGIALMSLAERESGTARLAEAVAAYREALKERPRDKVPLNWATTQNNLGNALASLGERESGTKRLEEAVAAFREALKEYTREKVPLDWAMTQNNLGTALRILGERESGMERLEEAVEAYREALKEYAREKVPLDWANTTENLGLVFGVLAIRQSDPEGYCASLVERLRALEVYQKAGAEYYEKKAARSIARGIEEKKKTFGEKKFEACRAKHADLFETLR